MVKTLEIVMSVVRPHQEELTRVTQRQSAGLIEPEVAGSNPVARLTNLLTNLRSLMVRIAGFQYEKLPADPGSIPGVDDF